VTNSSKPRTAAILWFVASACSFLAAVITYSANGQINWSLFAAAVFTAAIGFSVLRRSRPTGV
jgi:hypothetical protein